MKNAPILLVGLPLKASKSHIVRIETKPQIAQVAFFQMCSKGP